MCLTDGDGLRCISEWGVGEDELNHAI
ncbi:hypothetical protein AZE42_12549 [Rhizopogon vesiculosus]|uniref:Uncharacterized protein n=1 Tax=Rhizopogon vesiculosus TaxID=180088 RepID=A0A1J8PPU0_9AGAM|nr:hypothetical protein AZE42_12549 [Rhizopogon vesiculosus]